MAKNGIKKIVLFGSESTGKTTLAQQLAAHYQTVWVPEYSRLYQEIKGTSCDLSEVIPIAKGQLELESEAMEKANGLLICDTDILETKVYSEAYNKACPDWLIQQLETRLGDFYLLTNIDLPWEPDGIRDRPHDRAAMHRLFKKELIIRNLPFIEISGNQHERLQRAIRAIDEYCLNQDLQD